MATGDQKSVKEWAADIRARWPHQYDGYADDALVEGYLQANPGERSKVKYEIPGPTGQTTISAQQKVAPGGPFLTPPTGPTRIEKERPWYQRAALRGSEYFEPIGATAGGLIGGAGGAFTTGGPGSVPGAVSGAAIGGSAGEAVRQMLLHALGVASAPKTSSEAAERIGMAGVENAGYELAGQGGARLLPGGFEGGRVAGKEVTAEDIFRMSREPGIRMTPGQVRGASRGMWETISGLGMLSKKMTENYRKQTVQAAENLADQMLKKVAPRATPEASGQALEDALATAHAAFKAEGRIHYEPFRGTFGENIPTNFDSVVQLANDIEAKRTPMVKGKPVTIQSPLINPLTNRPFPPNIITPLEKLPLESPAGTLLKYLQNLQERPQNFKTAMEARDFLSQYMRGRDRLFFDQDAEAIARRAWKALGDQLSTSAVDYDRLHPGATASPQWEVAKAFWSEGRARFDNRFMVGLMKKDPELVAKSIKPGEVTKLREIKEILTSYGTPAEKARGRDAWRGFQRAFAEHRIISDPMQAEFKLQNLQTMKDRLNALGGPQLRELYGDPRGQVFVNNARTLSELMSRTDFQGGLAAGKWEVMYEIVALAGAGHAGGYTSSQQTEKDAGAAFRRFAEIQAAPAIINAVLHNRFATSLLLRSMMVPPTTRGAVVAAGQRIVGAVVKDLMNSQEDLYKGVNIDQSGVQEGGANAER